MSGSETGNGGSSLISDGSLSTIGAVLATGISGIASIIIARELGVESRGRWAVISSLAVIVSTFASAGLPIAVAFGGARLGGDDRVRFVQSALIATVVLATTAGAVYLGVAAILRPPAPAAVVAVGLSIPAATVVYAVGHALTLTVGSMRWYAAAQVLAALATLVAIIALAIAGAVTVLAVVIVSAGAQLIGACVCFVVLRGRHVLGTRLVVRDRATAVRALRPYLVYAAMTFATLSLTQVVQRLDLLLVSGFRGSHAAGLYAVAVQLTDLMLVVPGALGLVMFRRGARGSLGHFTDTMRVLRLTALFGIAASLLALALAGWAVPLVYGNAYRGAVTPLRWLLPGVIAFSVQSVLSSYLAGRGRPRAVLVAWLLGAVFGIGVDLFVIPAYGVVGAAIVSSLSYLLVTSVHIKAMRSLAPNGVAEVL